MTCDIMRKNTICDQPFPEKSFDVITLLEVLEHIPDVERAIQAAVKMAHKYIVVSVPSKPDDNPEHIHLLTKDLLTEFIDDLIATGGTIEAAADLVEQLGGEVVKICFVMELAGLEGRKI